MIDLIRVNRAIAQLVSEVPFDDALMAHRCYLATSRYIGHGVPITRPLIVDIYAQRGQPEVVAVNDMAAMLEVYTLPQGVFQLAHKESQERLARHAMQRVLDQIGVEHLGYFWITDSLLFGSLKDFRIATTGELLGSFASKAEGLAITKQTARPEVACL